MAFIGVFSFLAFLFFILLAIIPPLRRKVSPKLTIKKTLLYGLIGFIVMVITASIDDTDNAETTIAKNNDKAVVEEKIENKVEPVKELVKEEPIVISSPTPEPTIEPTPEPTTKETVGQRNAVRKAVDYLDYTAFSKSGLMEQLEFEGYSEEDAEYAVDQIDADWNEQAVKKAVDYLDYTAFSKSELVEQLEFEGFTSEQAKHGADKAYK